MEACRLTPDGAGTREGTSSPNGSGGEGGGGEGRGGAPFDGLHLAAFFFFFFLNGCLWDAAAESVTL